MEDKQISNGEPQQAPIIDVSKTQPETENPVHDLSLQRHKEVLSSERTKRTQARANAFITGSIIILAVVLVVIGFFIYKDIHTRKVQIAYEQTVEDYLDSGEYNRAIKEAKTEKYRAGNIKDFFRAWAAQGLEIKQIKETRKNDLLTYGITIGRSAKDFKGRPYDQVEEELRSKEFTQIKVTAMPKNDKKELNTVVEILIDGKKNFKATDRYLPNTPIEIRYRTKG